jgi:hypothetical protein
LFVPILELDLYRFSKRGNSFWLSFSGNKVEGCRISLSRRLAGTQHLPASFLPIFLNLQLNIESEGGQDLISFNISEALRFLQQEFFILNTAEREAIWGCNFY